MPLIALTRPAFDVPTTEERLNQLEATGAGRGEIGRIAHASDGSPLLGRQQRVTAVEVQKSAEEDTGRAELG